jgi:type II secretory pathway predicted ATPase ExeA
MTSLEKDFKIPTPPERRERALRERVRKRHKPVVLLVDDAHTLHAKTLLGLKRLIEVIRGGKGTLSVVLAGHPRLKNDLRRTYLKELADRLNDKPREVRAFLRGQLPPSRAQEFHQELLAAGVSL